MIIIGITYYRPHRILTLPETDSRVVQRTAISLWGKQTSLSEIGKPVSLASEAFRFPSWSGNLFTATENSDPFIGRTFPSYGGEH
jgi:hypothetical protein